VGVAITPLTQIKSPAPLDITDNHYVSDAVVFTDRPPLSLVSEKRETDTVETRTTNRDPSFDWVKPKRAAFGPSLIKTDKPQEVEDIDSDIPFASLLQRYSPQPPPDRMKQQQHPVAMEDSGATKKNNVGADNVGIKHRINAGLSQSPSVLSTLRRDITQSVTRDDFVILRGPFAGPEEETRRFYHECQAAPTLNMFEDLQEGDLFRGDSTSATTLGPVAFSITAQLAQFEANAFEFNEFVQSLQQDVDS